MPGEGSSGGPPSRRFPTGPIALPPEAIVPPTPAPTPAPPAASPGILRPRTPTLTGRSTSQLTAITPDLLKATRPPPAAPVDFALMTPAQRIVDEFLSVAWNEHVVVVHDRAHEDFGRALEAAANERRANVDRFDWEALAPRPWSSCPQAILDALREAAASVLCVSVEEGEYNARHAFISAVSSARTRHVHIIGSSKKSILSAMSASSARVFDLTATLKREMRATSKLTFKSAAGSQLEVEMAAHLRWFANAEVVRAGQWINIPYGALVTSPANANGVFVADAAVGGGIGAKTGLLASRPIRLTIENGRVKSVDSPDAALSRHVKAFMAEGANHQRVALVSLGTNIGMLAPLGEIVHDENMPGLHVSLGDTFQARTGQSWTAHGQLALAASGGDVDLDGQPLIRGGRYVRFV